MISGLHHISMKCGTPEEFEKSKAFYLDLLGFKIVREWLSASARLVKK